MPEFSETTPSLIGGAIGIGAVIAMISVLILSPLIDRFVRDRYSLGRGQTMLLLLGLSLVIGLISGLIGYQVLAARDVGDESPAEPAPQQLDRT